MLSSKSLILRLVRSVVGCLEEPPLLLEGTSNLLHFGLERAVPDHLAVDLAVVLVLGQLGTKGKLQELEVRMASHDGKEMG